MNPYQIVIDTNVFVSDLRSQRGAAYTLLTMLNDPRWQVNISTTKKSSNENGDTLGWVKMILMCSLMGFAILPSIRRFFMSGDQPRVIRMMSF